MLNGSKSYLGLLLYTVGWLLGLQELVSADVAEQMKQAGLLLYGGGMAHKLAKAEKK